MMPAAKDKRDMRTKATKRRTSVDPIDIHLGARLRQQRVLAGLSQERLGKELGITFQQIQKYERGTNRIRASTLFHMARILNVPVVWFYEEIPSSRSSGNLDQKTVAADDNADIAERRETLELIRTYYRIPKREQRRGLFNMLKRIVDGMEKLA